MRSMRWSLSCVSLVAVMSLAVASNALADQGPAFRLPCVSSSWHNPASPVRLAKHMHLYALAGMLCVTLSLSCILITSPMAPPEAPGWVAHTLALRRFMTMLLMPVSMTWQISLASLEMRLRARSTPATRVLKHTTLGQHTHELFG